MPTLILHALDDPFIRMLPETRATLLANPNVHLIETSTAATARFWHRQLGMTATGRSGCCLISCMRRRRAP